MKEQTRERVNHRQHTHYLLQHCQVAPLQSYCHIFSVYSIINWKTQTHFSKLLCKVIITCLVSSSIAENNGFCYHRQGRGVGRGNVPGAPDQKGAPFYWTQVKILPLCVSYFYSSRILKHSKITSWSACSRLFPLVIGQSIRFRFRLEHRK